MLVGNAIVGQSGGPTSAINATLSGIIRGASRCDSIKKLFGMKNGIEGFLDEEIIDLSFLFHDEDKLSLLETTPACALGSCRKKLPNLDTPSDVFAKIFEIFKKNDIRFFFYIGGNDSMDTAYKLSEYAKTIEYEIRIIGVPKTIDNDLPCTDHAPGYGSAAKFIATAVSEIATDCAVYKTRAVTIIEAMGRDAGWLACAGALARKYNGMGADLIYLPETPFYDNEFISAIEKCFKSHPNVVVLVSEGIRYENGEYVGASKQSGMVDVFGHRYLAGTAKNLEALVKQEIGCKVRSIELNLLQRCSSHILSATDISESVAIGKRAVELADSGQSGIMLTFVRKESERYEIDISCVSLEKVARRVKYVPRSFINSEGNNVTEECIDYISPLILGEMQIKYENGVPVHIRL
ncbi:MAG: 6-phosphofructokinase [Ruminococcaceae bacterium]|nr:6-phosphofructokinase [Oscillospiraceae bacterium]